jgi:hypothetical protein
MFHRAGGGASAGADSAPAAPAATAADAATAAAGIWADLDAGFSASKTWKVAKLTSEISSSPSVISRLIAVFCFEACFAWDMMPFSDTFPVFHQPAAGVPDAGGRQGVLSSKNCVHALAIQNARDGLGRRKP